jgi:hypothetical protein
MESIGLYHQTGNGTSRFLLAKSISRPDWGEPAARLAMTVNSRDCQTITLKAESKRMVVNYHK